jgi:hypothetical protein
MNCSVFLSTTLTLLLAILGLSCSKQDGDFKAGSEQSTMQATGSEVGNKQSMVAGSVRGRVIFEGEPPRPRRLMVVKDTDICGRDEQFDKRLIVSKNKGIQNAVVYLTGVHGGKPLTTLGSEFILDQRGCRYEPHVILVPVNTPLQILNNDGILHNFHTFSKKNRPVNVSQPKFRKKMELTFKHPEFIQARCDIHGWMSCWIIAMDQPYYAITTTEGNFSLSDIPPGTYTLTCWQEMLGERTEQVTIAPGSAVSSTFTF